MTKEEIEQISTLRKQGYGYSRISKAMGISVNTIKAYCKRHGMGGVQKQIAVLPTYERMCLCCGAGIVLIEGRKEKKFCSSKCRNKWWNSHLDQVNRKANYYFTCKYCNKPFTAYGNRNRKYCCHECYVADRFGGEM